MTMTYPVKATSTVDYSKWNLIDTDSDSEEDSVVRPTSNALKSQQSKPVSSMDDIDDDDDVGADENILREPSLPGVSSEVVLPSRFLSKEERAEEKKRLQDTIKRRLREPIPGNRAQAEAEAAAHDLRLKNHHRRKKQLKDRKNAATEKKSREEQQREMHDWQAQVRQQEQRSGQPGGAALTAGDHGMGSAHLGNLMPSDLKLAPLPAHADDGEELAHGLGNVRIEGITNRGTNMQPGMQDSMTAGVADPMMYGLLGGVTGGGNMAYELDPFANGSTLDEAPALADPPVDYNDLD